jgi:hypothetical protein
MGLYCKRLRVKSEKFGDSFLRKLCRARCRLSRLIGDLVGLVGLGGEAGGDDILDRAVRGDFVHYYSPLAQCIPERLPLEGVLLVPPKRPPHDAYNYHLGVDEDFQIAAGAPNQRRDGRQFN